MPAIATFFDHILDITHQQNISIPEALQEAANLGITQMEISIDTARAHLAGLPRDLAAAGMTISTIPSYFDFAHNMDVEAQAAPIFETAKAVGGDRLLVIPGFTDGLDQETQTQAMIAAVARLGELAEKAGLRLTMEDFDNAASPCSTSGGMLRFLEACPSLTACFDTGNFRFMAKDELSAYGALRGRIGHVHLKDRAPGPEYGDDGVEAADGVMLYPCPVGRGMIQMEPVLDLLREDGYDGTYTIEHYGARDALDCLRKSVEWLRGRLN